MWRHNSEINVVHFYRTGSHGCLIATGYLGKISLVILQIDLLLSICSCACFCVVQIVTYIYLVEHVHSGCT